MYRLYSGYLIPTVCAVINLGLNIKTAQAQVSYTFNATYNVSSNASAITPNVSATTILGTSDDAPYNLTKVTGLTYSQVDFATGNFRFNTDASTFGLQSLPVGEVVFFGNSSNKLFGTNNATGVIDFQTLTGTASNIFTITRGEGIFKGASGILTLTESYQISLNPAIPTTGKSIVTGTIEVLPEPIPEPNNNTALFFGMIGAAFLLRRSRKSIANIA